MRLCFDIGNTRAKVALYEGSRLVDRGLCTEAFMGTLLRHYGHDIQEAVASVVGVEPDWGSLLPQGLRLHKLGHRSPLPFQIVGEHPESIGADRIAALLGAWQRYPGQELVVVDAGTCVTLDYLSADGRYTPGVILPGMQLCLNAMHEHTALLPQLRFDSTLEELHLQPRDTKDCLLSGVAYMGLFAVEGLLNRTPQARPLLTGGDAEWLLSHMGTPAELCKNLLFEGLNSIKL